MSTRGPRRPSTQKIANHIYTKKLIPKVDSPPRELVVKRGLAISAIKKENGRYGWMGGWIYGIAIYDVCFWSGKS